MKLFLFWQKNKNDNIFNNLNYRMKKIDLRITIPKWEKDNTIKEKLIKKQKNLNKIIIIHHKYDNNHIKKINKQE